MKPDRFTPLGLYGNIEKFDERLNQGYTQVARGTGPWIKPENSIEEQRVVNIFAFYHPDGRIATTENFKCREPNDAMNRSGGPKDFEYNQSDFEKHIQEFGITLDKKMDLETVLALWDK